MPLSRAEVVQGLLGRHSVPSYLEIGVSTGATFHAVKASRKVAVDPHFDFDLEAARASQPEAQYHEITSDEYFGRIAAPSDRFDVIFLDETDPIASPLKAKGIAELGICGVAAAVANAVYNATGIRVRDYPITLDKLIDRLPPVA